MSPQHQVKVGPDAEAGTARHSDPEPWGGECQEPRWKVEKDQGQGSVLPEMGICARWWQTRRAGGVGAIDSEQSKLVGEGSTGKQV